LIFIDGLSKNRLFICGTLMPGLRLQAEMQGQQMHTCLDNRPVDGCTPIPHGDYRRHIRKVGRDS
jgi:hypothetical protein